MCAKRLEGRRSTPFVTGLATVLLLCVLSSARKILTSRGDFGRSRCNQRLPRVSTWALNSEGS
jgi:hypothetical protein